MHVRDVKRLIDAMAASDLAELEYEQRDGDGPVVFRIKLRRGRTEGEATGVSAPTVAPAAAQPVAPPAPSPEAPAEAPPAAAAPSRHVDVTAPIVGTFYASPAPDAGPYVKVGDRVQPGTILCIIEAMKLMNEIESEVAGTIVEVLVSNEEPVEYGQVLFRIDPS